MTISKIIEAIDTHTMGQPTRIVRGGILRIDGDTMAEKKQYLIDNMDHIRTALMLEPRGHNNMFGAIYTQPCNPEAHFGMIFMDGGGYLNMCGHGSIGAVTASIETGLIEVEGPYAEVIIDTPAGLVKTISKMTNGLAEEVSIVNIPSFLYKKDIQVEVPGCGIITLDIAFGGSFFALVDAKEVGYDIKPENVMRLTQLGMEIRECVNRQVQMQHPELEHIKTCDLVEFYCAPTHPDAHSKNVVVFGQGQVDRSPCGTGTCAKLAALHARGLFNESEVFVSESIIGTLFKCRIVDTCKVGEFDAIIPEITGSAYITGFNTFMLNNRDPIEHGFYI